MPIIAPGRHLQLSSDTVPLLSACNLALGPLWFAVIAPLLGASRVATCHQLDHQGVAGASLGLMGAMVLTEAVLIGLGLRGDNLSQLDWHVLRHHAQRSLSNRSIWCRRHRVRAIKASIGAADVVPLLWPADHNVRVQR